MFPKSGANTQTCKAALNKSQRCESALAPAPNQEEVPDSNHKHLPSSHSTLPALPASICCPWLR